MAASTCAAIASHAVASVTTRLATNGHGVSGARCTKRSKYARRTIQPSGSAIRFAIKIGFEKPHTSSSKSAARLAPWILRTPISRVRRLTRKLASPNKPVLAITNATAVSPTKIRFTFANSA